MRVETSLGETIELGTTATGLTVGLIDYSRRETDDFGVTTVVQRSFSRRLSARIALPFDQADAVQRALAGLRATAAKWIADDRFEWLQPIGYYRDFSIDLAVPPTSYCTLTVEGLAETSTAVDAGGDPAPAGSPSTLQLLHPIAVTDAVLTASTVPESDAPAWAGGTSYAAGATVVKGHRIYESLVAGNVGQDPAASPDKWLDTAPTNRWAMFDEALGTSTVAVGSMAITLNGVGATCVAMLDVVGVTVRVQATGYDQTVLVGSGPITLHGLPGTGSIIVTIAGSGAVAVGTLLIGNVRSLGVTEAAPNAAITDYSRKEVDDFGEVSIVQRAWAKRMTARALIRTDAIDAVADRIASVRARPVLWIGQAGMDSLTIYGFFRDFSIEAGENVSKLSLSIEGLSKAAPVGVDPIAAAQAAAEAAQATADGKSTITWEATPPAAGDSVEGDSWAGAARVAHRRLPGTGLLAIGADRIFLGGGAIELAWTEAPDQRIVQALLDAAGAAAIADGKVQAFSMRAASDPVPTGSGRGDILYRNYLSPPQIDRWDGFGWVSQATYGATAAQAGTIAESAARVAAILSDGILSRGAEKRGFIREWLRAQADYTALVAKAAGFAGVDDAIDDLYAAYAALALAIAAITPAYSDTTQDSVIPDAAGLQAKWDSYFTTHAALLMAITAQTLVVQWSVDGLTGWHADYAAGDKWQRQSINGGASWADAVKVVGEDGSDGTDGIPGTPGANGQTLYTWVAYANAADGTVDFTTGAPGTRTYLGLATNKATATESTSAADYAWSKIKGEQGPAGADGLDGTDGLPGAPGANGVSTYLHTAYANSANGTADFTTGAPGSRTYLGVLTDTNPADSTTPGDYSWSLIKGADGANGTPGTPGADGVPSYVHIAWATAADGSSGFSTTVSAGKTHIGFYTDATLADSANPALYAWSLIKGAQGDGGPQGPQGVPGEPGADGTPRYIWIAYADSADGSVNFTNGAPGTRSYIGVSPNQTASTESSDPAAYNWAKITGATGAAGVDGKFTSFVFKRAATQPATPTADSTPPAGWSDAPPAQTDPATALWQTTADFRDAARLTAWATPKKLVPADLDDLDPGARLDINDARDVAHSKNKVLWEPALPAAADSQAGDVLFNTALGNRAHRRLPGTGMLAIGGDRIMLGGGAIELAWTEAPDQRIAPLVLSLAEAVDAAQDADAKADDAIAGLIDLADDGVLDVPEKKIVLIPKNAQLEMAWATLDDLAADLGVTTERTAAATARSAWTSYRDGLSPPWNSTSAATPVVRSTHRQKLGDYEIAIDALRRAVGTQVSIVAPQNAVVTADYTGTLTAGQFPKVMTPQVARGGASIRTADTTGYALSNISAGGTGAVSVNNTNGSANKGKITVTDDMTAAFSFTLAITVGGVAQAPIPLAVAVERAPPPTGGGGSGGGTGNKSGTDSNFPWIGSASHAELSDVFTVDVASGETIRCYAALDYQYAGASGTANSVTAVWRHRPAAGGSWTDFAAEVTGIASGVPDDPGGLVGPIGTGDPTGDPYPGSVTCNQDAAGLSAGLYDVALFGRLSTAGGGIGITSGAAAINVST